MQRLAQRRVQVERGHGIGKRAADQKFHREVVHPPRLRVALLGLILHPTLRQLRPRHFARRLHQFLGIGLVWRYPHGLQQMAVDGFGKLGAGGRIRVVHKCF